MVDGAFVAQLKDMLTIVFPNPDGKVNIGAAGQNDSLKRVLKLMGFEFLTMKDEELEAIRTELAPDGEGNVTIDNFARYLDNYVTECTDDDALTKAFKEFDADNDNKLTVEEFKFFMTAFAKEYDSMQDRKLVENMLNTIYREGMANKDDPSATFDIPEIVQRMKKCWAN